MSETTDYLWSVAEDVATAFGYSFASDCRTLLQDLVRRGAERVDLEATRAELADAEAARAAARERASHNTMLFVITMVAEARRLQLPALHEPTYHAGLEKLCPIWPFC